MIASVRKFLPKAKIIQLCNDDFIGLGECDEVFRYPNKGDFIEWGFGALIEIIKRGEPVLQIATDIILNSDVSDVFNQEFDVAACQYPLKDRADGAFCGDVNFIKPSGLAFWERTLELYKNGYGLKDGWDGGQRAFTVMAHDERHKVISLDYNTYCYTPDDFYEDISEAKIIHFRGNRKGMMLHYAKPMNLLSPYQTKTVGTASDEEIIENVKNTLMLPHEFLADQYMGDSLIEVCIVGGAPSLKYSIGEIKQKQQEGAVVWALNNAYKYLIENGIEPSAQIILDARQENAGFIPEKTRSLLLLASQCHPDVFKRAEKSGGEIIIWHNMIFGLLPLVKGKKAAIVGSSSTVGISAINLARLFGLKKVHLFGYDSSYENDENHAYSQPLNNKENVVEVTVNDKKFKAAAWMVGQVEDFKNRINDFLASGLEITVHGHGLLPYVASLLTPI